MKYFRCRKNFSGRWQYYGPRPASCLCWFCSLLQGIAPMSGYLGVFTIDINAVWPPEGTVYGQMAKQFAVR